jgi:predicted nucleic acid-binding protein
MGCSNSDSPPAKRKQPTEVIQEVKEFSPPDFAISAITVSELEYGASKSRNPKKNRQTLVTNNLNEFGRVPGLSTVNWA